MSCRIHLETPCGSSACGHVQQVITSIALYERRDRAHSLGLLVVINRGAEEEITHHHRYSTRKDHPATEYT